MDDRKLLRTGACGTGFAMICCFTPVLVVLLPAIGLGAWLAWADYVLWPVLAISLGIMAYALWARRCRRATGCAGSGDGASS